MAHRRLPAFLPAAALGAALSTTSLTASFSGALTAGLTTALTILAPAAEAQTQTIGFLPGETLHVDVYARPELSGDKQLDGQGRIALPLAGRITAQGLSAEDLEQAIADKLRKAGLDQNPAVTVTAVKRLDIYVDGAVANPGAYPWRPGLTVAQVMALAGGRVTVSADDLGPTLNALRSVEYAAGMERRAQSLQLFESRILSEMAHASAAYGPQGTPGTTADGFLALPAHLTGQPALRDLIASQTEIFTQNIDNRQQRHRALLDQKRLNEERLNLLEQRRKSVEDETAIIADRLAAYQGLAERKLARTTDLMNLQRASSSANSSLIEVLASIAEAKLELQQTELELRTFGANLRGELSAELSRVQTDLLDMRARLDPALQAGMVGAAYEGAVPGAGAATLGLDKDLSEGGGATYSILRVAAKSAAPQALAGQSGSTVMPGDTITVTNGTLP